MLPSLPSEVIIDTYCVDPVCIYLQNTETDIRISLTCLLYRYVFMDDINGLVLGKIHILWFYQILYFPCIVITRKMDMKCPMNRQ